MLVNPSSLFPESLAYAWDDHSRAIWQEWGAYKATVLGRLLTHPDIMNHFVDVYSDHQVDPNYIGTAIDVAATDERFHFCVNTVDETVCEQFCSLSHYNFFMQDTTSFSNTSRRCVVLITNKSGFTRSENNAYRSLIGLSYGNPPILLIRV